MSKNVLLLIDIQNDFCEGGALAVPHASEIIPIVNQLQAYFDCIIATQDWHPEDHISFASHHPGHAVGTQIPLDTILQTLWPDHCIQHSEGAALHPDLKTDQLHHIYKGTDPHIDSYSAFFDNAHQRSTGLQDYLHQNQIKNIYIAGLATDYCVKYSALDAAALGFNVYVIEDACRGIDLTVGDIEKAYNEMQKAGVKRIHSADVIATLKAQSVE